MRFALKTLATALVIGLVLPSHERRAGRRRQQHRHDPGTRRRQQRRRAARRHRDRDEPVDDRRADAGHERERHRIAFPRCLPGVYALTFELAGFSTVKRDGVQISLGFTATVNAELAVATLQETVTVTGRLAGDRHVGDPRAAELQARTAQLDSQRPRHVGAARGDAWRGHEQHRRRRQPRRHADRLPRLRPDRPGAHLGRRHQHDRRHRRRRLLLRLRLVRRSVPRRRRPGRGGGHARRAVELPRQVGRQQVLGRVLRRRLQQLVPGVEPERASTRGRRRRAATASARAATRCCATTTSTSTSAVRSRRTRPGGTSRGAASSTPSSSRSSPSISRSTPGTRIRRRRSRIS